MTAVDIEGEVVPRAQRILQAEPDARFRITMHNDFLTPRGRPYKWSEVIASLSRSLAAGAHASTVLARYTWDHVEGATGTPEESQKPRQWRFATGHSFWQYLLNTRIADVTDPGTDGPVPSDGFLHIAYPDLPGTPAVDMLLMLSWDVVTMEMLAGHLANTPELRIQGRSANVNRVSGTQAGLRFASAGNQGMFRNSEMTAVWLGIGLRGGRPAAIFRYECLDCDLVVRSGPIEQRGRSSYWGIVETDLATGDLVAAEMTEMIVATLSGADGRRVPVQKRRLIRMEAVGEGDVLSAPPVRRAAGSRVSPDGGAVGHAAAVAAYLRRQRDLLTGLPASVTPMFEMGFTSIVGLDPPAALARVEDLAERLRTGEGGGAAAALDDRSLLEGLLSFSTLAVELGGTMEAQHAIGLRMLCELSPDDREHVSELIAVLDRSAG